VGRSRCRWPSRWPARSTSGPSASASPGSRWTATTSWPCTR
jgi:hypothetical protein